MDIASVLACIKKALDREILVGGFFVDNAIVMLLLDACNRQIRR